MFSWEDTGFHNFTEDIDRLLLGGLEVSSLY